VGDSEPLTVQPWKRLAEGAQWDELSMPAATVAALKALPGRLSERLWGGAGGRAGLLAVFRGPAGSGKTLAIRTVATELQLPVFQADLARLVAGGPAHIARALVGVFTSAQQSGAVLELDGADVLADDARNYHLEPVGLDVGDLVRRCEASPGLVVVSCRHVYGPIELLAESADLVLDFGLPDSATRVDLWRRHLPADAEVGDGEIALLADGFPVSAGAIAAACETAATQAQAEGGP
jgi:hypothetical protein